MTYAIVPDKEEVPGSSLGRVTQTLGQTEKILEYLFPGALYCQFQDLCLKVQKREEKRQK